MLRIALFSLLPALAYAQSTAAGTATATTTLSVDSSLPQTPLNTAPPSGYVIPDLTALTANQPPQTTIPLDTTYPPSATPTAASFAGFPLPATLPNPANYPALDKVPPTNSTEVQQWLSELDLSDVPNLSTTTGACFDSPAQAADKTRCWWTCGQCTRPSDITACPTKYDWGLSYDDGPSPYTPVLLDYLNEHDITTTFFVVGSRVISRPAMVQSEHMAGHQISVHTWSHSYLTNLTNEQIVAELGWTKKVIKDTIGVTPNTMRPPYGDIDDRVRAISAKMGLTPIIWTYPAGGPEFDTTDWKINGGTATGESSLAKFGVILNKAATLNTGFILLAHDLYQQAVDLAVGYVLPAALNSTSPYKLKSIIDCMNQPLANAYIETNSNSTTIANTVSGDDASTSFPVATRFGAAAVNSGSTTAAASTGASSTGSRASAASVTSTGTRASAAATTTAASGASARVSGSLLGTGLQGLAAVGLVAVGAVLVL